jgi:hypothetical protein
MQENNTTIQLRSFAEIHLHLTKRNAKNANISPKMSSLNKCTSQFQPRTQGVVQISDLTNE